MPLHDIFEKNHCRIGLWDISESPEELMHLVSLSNEEKIALENFKGAKRRAQWLAVRALLPLVSKEEFCSITYDGLGKPILNDHQAISISHSGNMVAIQLCASDFCGVDIQKFSEKMSRLASKFINDQEYSFIPQEQCLEYYNLIWTMKEAIFKNFGSDLEFKGQIEISSFEMNATGSTTARVVHRNKTYSIGLEWQRIGEYFLTYLC